MPADERNKHPGIAANADPWDESGACDLVRRAGRRRHDAARPAAVPRHAGAGDGRQLRARRVPHVADRGRARRSAAARCSTGRFETVGLPTIELDPPGARGTRPSTTCSSRARPTAAWRRSAGRSTASTWASAAATASWSPPRSARPATTSRPAARSWAGASTRWCSPSSPPHALDARPLVLSHGHKIRITSHSIGFSSRVVVDGHVVGSLEEDGVRRDPARAVDRDASRCCPTARSWPATAPRSPADARAPRRLQPRRDPRRRPAARPRADGADGRDRRGQDDRHRRARPRARRPHRQLAGRAANGPEAYVEAAVRAAARHAGPRGLRRRPRAGRARRTSR